MYDVVTFQWSLEGTSCQENNNQEYRGRIESLKTQVLEPSTKQLAVKYLNFLNTSLFLRGHSAQLV